MVVKELGKLTPYVRNKGALLAREGAEKRLWRLFIKNTALYKLDKRTYTV